MPLRYTSLLFVYLLWLCGSNLSQVNGDPLKYVDQAEFEGLERLVENQASAIGDLTAKLTALSNKVGTTHTPPTSCDCGTLQTKVDSLNNLRTDVATLKAELTGLNNQHADIASLQAAVAGFKNQFVEIATLESKVAGLTQHFTDVAGLQNKVADLSSLKIDVATLNAKTSSLGDLHASVSELSDKIIRISAAVAFSAMFTTDEPTLGISVSAHSILTFDKTITNIGNGYSTTSGKFTAPVSGVYAFSLHVMVPNAGGHLEVAIMKQGMVLDLAWAPDTHDFEDQGSTQVTTHLRGGDQVWVQVVDGNAVRGSYWTVFTGYLLQSE